MTNGSGLTSKPFTAGSLAFALSVAFASIVTSGTSVDAQVRVPGWNRVAPPGGHQNDPQLVRPTGGPVVPIFEGWFPNPDGSYQLCFGYFNTNTEQVIDLPVGLDNFIEPREFDGLQPTHFLPQPDGGRRHYCVLSVNVPTDWGDRDLIWTLRDERSGQAFSSPGRIIHSTYRHDEPLQLERQNSPPKIKLDPAGEEVMGRVGSTTGTIAGPLEATVGEPLPLTAWVRRDNPFRENDRRSIRVRWFKYQGPGDVTFTPDWPSWKERTVGWVDSATWLESADAYGQSNTEATFDEPGEYLLHVQAYNASGRAAYEVSDFEFFCCWTNAFVRINVSR